MKQNVSSGILETDTYLNWIK